ncbi:MULTISPECIES: 4a-hydroxytetrahydrobiopterin dehydratase [Mumia]|uniref:4a-hydroxytetrahydrobiopterin dehydratase n=1 Tax=Mumia TaxID=1546255 RepID=UPI00141E24F6|nr:MULTISPECIES: 4a-hydroxytetrahydrobiopterin dehydratase [unclassified Mumia]QMW67238.1 4a-hydroxytetrahydrobiopterin dehydratase [Mumia sp. ZJ1417]
MDAPDASDSLMSDAEIAEALLERPAWVRDGDTIVRSVRAPTYIDGIALVDAVAAIAEEADHHPDITIRWREVTFILTTHSASGLTARDFTLAGVIDVIADAAGDT